MVKNGRVASLDRVAEAEVVIDAAGRTAVPGLIPLVLLDRDPSNLPLVALCLVPLGPALSAMLFALRHRSRDLTDLHPAAAFWRGYRLNVWPVLRLWVPWLLGMTVISVNLAYFQAAAVPGWWAVLLVIIAVGATLCALILVNLARRPTDPPGDAPSH